jgi:paraquat-inducible protein B
MRSSLFMIMVFLLASCEPAEDYKQIRAEVVTEHDKVMLDNERAVENSRKLDSLALNMDNLKKTHAGLDTNQVGTEISELKGRLQSAGSDMDRWMKEFDAELGSKSKPEAISYFKAEKVKLERLDSIFNAVLKESGEYLRRMR